MIAFLPLLLRALPYIVGAALLVGGWFYADRACWSTACQNAQADLSALVKKVAAEDEARATALAKRRADDERANARIREMHEAADRELAAANARAVDADKRAAALAAKLRATPAGGCLLPADARRVWNESIVPRGGAAPGPAAAPDREAAAPGATSAGSVAADDLAARPGDNAPTDCVTTWEVGRRNTARATFNADELDSCNVEKIDLWQSCTGKTFKEAP